MDIAYGHFYVEDAAAQRCWFETALSFQSAHPHKNAHTQTEIVYRDGVCLLLSSALTAHSPVANYLQSHPPGLVDLAFRVRDIDRVMERATLAQVPVLQAVRSIDGPSTDNGHDQVKVAQLLGWGKLRHTLIESVAIHDAIHDGHFRHGVVLWDDIAADQLIYRLIDGSDNKLINNSFNESITDWLMSIDHAVLNVEKGDLTKAIAFYNNGYGFYAQQSFRIRTEHSALSSQVLAHPDGTAQLPVNEPASANSQIQEFLDYNSGSGIQHLALRTSNIVGSIAQFRRQGLAFLAVPPSYYEQLQARAGFPLTEAELGAIATQEVLADWPDDQPEALLLQAFTQPIFQQPTFFFELIERRQYWVGDPGGNAPFTGGNAPFTGGNGKAAHPVQVCRLGR